MSTSRSELRREGVAATLIGTLVLAPALAGCGIDLLGNRDEPAGIVTSSSAHSLDAFLTERARAVRRGDREAFVGQISGGSAGFAVEQETWFENLAQLPLQRFRYRVVDGSITDLGDEVSATVRLALQLEGYDARPVVTERRMRFVREQTETGTPLRLAAASVVPGQGGATQPWDVGPIQVRSGRGVLGIFDEDSVRAADEVLRAVAEGIDVVAGAVPYVWDRKVVVYALSDTAVLASIEDLPGGDPDRLDGVAFPVHVRPGSAKVAGHRFMLHPRMLAREGVARDRLIRHELTHVALGRLDDDVPTWFAEGLAEYLSVQSIPLQDRMISRDALAAARDGVTTMPSNETFNGPLSGANYGISWWACEYIADTYGRPMLWDLFDAFRAQSGGQSQDDVVRGLLGIDTAGLVEQAARRIVGTFG